MPWTPEDFKKKHNKMLSNASANKASNMANKILAETGDEGKAIRIANSAVRPSISRRLKKMKEKKSYG